MKVTMAGAAEYEAQQFFRHLEGWIQTELPAIENGIRRVPADPMELVHAFAPFLTQAKTTLGQHLQILKPIDLRRLKADFDEVLDAIERGFIAAKEKPAIGFGYLDGMEDILVAVSMLLTRKERDR